jgi:3-oxoacyl-[acyl-carrier protein] reductase
MRNVVVTGGSCGLGLSIARCLAAGGYRVIALARHNNDSLASAVTHAEQHCAGSLKFVPFDLNEIGGIPYLVKRLRQEFGPIYGLVNNAALGLDGALANMHNSQIERLVRLNILSPIVLKIFGAPHDG